MVRSPPELAMPPWLAQEVSKRSFIYQKRPQSAKKITDKERSTDVMTILAVLAVLVAAALAMAGPIADSADPTLVRRPE